MNRFIFAVTLAGLATSSGHAFAQERVARAGAIKPARTAAAPHAEDKSKKAAKAPTPSNVGEGTTLVISSESGIVDAHPGEDLADIQGHGVTTTTSGTTERTVASVVTDTKVPRLVATPRLLRRMNADHVVVKLAEDFRACYVEDPAEKSAPSSVVRVEVAASGAVDHTSVESGAKTTPQVTACIASAAATTKFNPPGGIGTAVLVQVRTR